MSDRVINELATWVQEHGEMRYDDIEQAKQSIAPAVPLLMDLHVHERAKDSDGIFRTLVLLDNMSCSTNEYRLTVNGKRPDVLLHDLWFPFSRIMLENENACLKEIELTSRLLKRAMSPTRASFNGHL